MPELLPCGCLVVARLVVHGLTAENGERDAGKLLRHDSWTKTISRVI
jgi:hypothetical protein